VQNTEMTNWAVDLIDVQKTYRGKVQALRGVNVQVGRGEIFGLLGPNGAGKSTLVKIMMTVVKPDRVAGTILGRPIGNRRKLALIGYLPENHQYPRYLTGSQLLDYYAALANVPSATRKQRACDLLERMGLTEWANTRIDRYSKGMMQRLGLAQAMMNDPELIILDEPTDGVDPMGRRDIRELLIELRKQGKTVFINSHMLSELEMVCDRVSILVGGLVARQGTLNELTAHTTEYRIQAAADLTPFAEKVAQIGGTVQQNIVVVTGHDPRKVNDVVDLIRAADIFVETIEPRRFSLEQVFVEALGTQAQPGVARPVGESSSAANHPKAGGKRL